MCAIRGLAGIFGIVASLQTAAELPRGVVNTQNPADKPLLPAEALKRFQLPAGFRATLFAGEPNVLQPIAFDFDNRGRLWVVECFSYPDWKSTGQDRIIILEDTDGNGVFDTRKIFWDKGHRLSGIAVGFGGVWLTSSPELIFLPDADRNDVPDGKPQVKLEGFTLEAGHNMVNGITWGLDGWLYGRHGITDTSLVGSPETPENRRVLLNCSIWRYHPVTGAFEVVARGTTNPWGLDWDENGQAFFSNNVIGHLWHLIPGARYKRMFGEDFNPYLYKLMDECSDHFHWAGSDWTKSRGGVGVHGQLGGGHAHSGAMIYQGNNWPAEYRRRLLMVNIHGNRILFDDLQRKGSGYVARHGNTFLMANDQWFRGVSIHYGPDGGVYVSDWNDTGECHDYDGSYRSSGRIYKITFGQPKPFRGDLQRLSDSELVKLQTHQSEWFARRSRRILQERASQGTLSKDAVQEVRELFKTKWHLRALWTMQSFGNLSIHELTDALASKNEHVRYWAVQLLSEKFPGEKEVAERLEKVADEESSALVRLSLASACQRILPELRWSILEKLSQHAEDTKDQNIPLMLWYATEPLVPKNRKRAVELMQNSKIPIHRQFIARRLADR